VIVDPLENYVELYRLAADGEHAMPEVFGKEDTLAL